MKSEQIVSKINMVLDQKGIKKIKLAESIGVPATTLNSWLNRSKDFPASYAKSIADSLGVSISWLLSDEIECGFHDSGGILSEEEEFILHSYRLLDQEGKIVVANKAIEELRRIKE